VRAPKRAWNFSTPAIRSTRRRRIHAIIYDSITIWHRGHPQMPMPRWFFWRRSVARIGGCSRGCRGRMLRCKLPGYSIFFLRNMFFLLLLHTSTREVCGADWGECGGREWTAWRAAYSSSPRREVPGESSEHISQLVSVYVCGSTREGCNKADCVVVEKQACRWRFRFEVQFHEHIHSMYACEEE